MTFKTSPAADAPFHLVVWIDRQGARLINLAQQAGETAIPNKAESHGHAHHKAGTVGPGHAALDEHFLKNVMDAIGAAREILIVGPADAKNALRKFLDHHAPAAAARVMGVEAMDHASESEIRKFAAHFFRGADRMKAAPR